MFQLKEDCFVLYEVKPFYWVSCKQFWQTIEKGGAGRDDHLVLWFGGPCVRVQLF